MACAAPGQMHGRSKGGIGDSVCVRWLPLSLVRIDVDIVASEHGDGAAAERDRQCLGSRAPWHLPGECFPLAPLQPVMEGVGWVS